MGDLAQFDPDFEIRLIQFATTDYALVLDLADPAQETAAIGCSATRTRASPATPRWTCWRCGPVPAVRADLDGKVVAGRELAEGDQVTRGDHPIPYARYTATSV